jgi:hypothetical protein
MRKLRTHYDTLKVAQDAPVEVIQAAYRTLARKYHPDRTGGAAESETMMKSINAAYSVLTDPAERAKHDAWIATQQRRGAEDEPIPEWRGAGPRPPGPAVDPNREEPRENVPPTVTVEWLVYAACYLAIALFLLRLPGVARLVGVGMLIAGFFIVKARSDRR